MSNPPRDRALPVTPDGIPVLARGRHRTPRGGACFMEFASYLAGERWSDHPDCTHPTLARLARLVNDCTSDGERGRLAVMIPSVVGLVAPRGRGAAASDTLDLTIALLTATAALPIASESRQRALAVTVIRCTDRLVAGGALPDDRLSRADAALAAAPQAAAWARHEISVVPARASQALPIATEAMIALAVTGIAEACATDVDGTLRAVLAEAIGAARDILQPVSVRATTRARTELQSA